MHVQWYEWEEDEGGYLSKCLQNGMLKTALATVQRQLTQFVWHQFIK